MLNCSAIGSKLIPSVERSIVPIRTQQVRAWAKSSFASALNSDVSTLSLDWTDLERKNGLSILNHHTQDHDRTSLWICIELSQSILWKKTRFNFAGTYVIEPFRTIFRLHFEYIALLILWLIYTASVISRPGRSKIFSKLGPTLYFILRRCARKGHVVMFPLVKNLS